MLASMPAVGATFACRAELGASVRPCGRMVLDCSGLGSVRESLAEKLVIVLSQLTSTACPALHADRAQLAFELDRVFSRYCKARRASPQSGRAQPTELHGIVVEDPQADTALASVVDVVARVCRPGLPLQVHHCAEGISPGDHEA